MSDPTNIVKDSTGVLKDALDFFTEVGGKPASVTLFVLALFFLIVAIALSANAVKTPPGDMPRSRVALLFLSVCAAVIFGVFGSAQSVVEGTRDVAGLRKENTRLNDMISHPISMKVVEDNLKENKKITWAIRLIAYEPGELPLTRLTKLGRDEQDFTFVGSYNELRNHSVADALRMIGAEIPRAQRPNAWAIVFNISGQKLFFPANARGVLQVIREVDETRANASEGNAAPFDVDSRISPTERENLKERFVGSYSFAKYGKYYGGYCRLIQLFRCEQSKIYTAKAHLPGLEDDWHPLGFARNTRDEADACSPALCQTVDWETIMKASKDNFGSRVFLVKNQLLSSFDKLYIMNFDDLNNQVIPDLGLKDE